MLSTLTALLLLPLIASDMPHSFPLPTSSKTIDCSSDYTSSSASNPTCTPSQCSRYIFDDFATPGDVKLLKSMAERAIDAGRGDGGRPGPTIVDINSGYMRDDQGLVNMYESNSGTLFSAEEYGFYRDTIERIRRTVGQAFGLPEEFPVFTAPTFITRLKHDDEWRPASMHDVYWMEHVDKNNTAHYDYSGLLYLTTIDDDFTGGMFEFVTEVHDEKGELADFELDEAVAPKAGRLISFTAGNENPHKVNLVKGGTRFVLSFWFTCDTSMKFGSFLDGSAHKQYQNEGHAEGEL